jgi:mannose-6-phosphate isomerase-like protein (cupin superfamily)
MSQRRVTEAVHHQVLSLSERLADAQTDGATARGSVSQEELRRVFGAPWRSVELVRQAAGSVSGRRHLIESDVLLFVVSGKGNAEFSSGPLELQPGVSVAILKGEEYSITAASDADLELFCAEMALAD